MKTSILCQSAVLVLAVAAFAGCSKQARAARRTAQADKDLAAGDYDKAEVEYQGVLQLGTNDPKAIGHLGVLYFDEGRPITAFRYLRAGAHLAPQLIDVRVKLGLDYLQLGSPKDARETAKDVLASDPTNADALLLLVDCCRTKQDVAAALEFVNGLRQANPDCAGYHIALGMLALFQGNQPDAESELRQAIALDPKSSAAYLSLGNLFVMRRDAAQAGEAFQTAADLAPLRSSTRLRYVDFLFATKKGDEAKKVLAEINTKTPDYIPGLTYAAQLALNEHRYADCDEFIQKVLMRDPQNYEALMERASLSMAQGKPAQATEELTKAEAIYERSPQIKYQLGVAYLSQGDLVKAEDRLNQAISLDPNLDQARYLLAKLELQKGNPEAAVGLLNAQIEKHPQAINRAYPILAQAYLAERNPDQAMAIYRRVALLSPQDPQVPYLMGMLFAQQNDPERARISFERALEILPAYAPALDMLVNTDLAEQHVDAASTLIHGLLVKYPKSAGPWLLQAKVDLVRNNLGATEGDLLKAIELDPNAPAAYLELAQVYVSEHKTAEAVKKLQALADKTPSPRALMLLGVLHSSMKQYEAAGADYEKILTFDPKFAPALNNLAYLYAEHLGKIEPAYDFAKRARAADPDSANVADTLGWILYRKGDFRNALDLVQECLQKDPGNVAAEYHLGMIYYMLGEEDMARQAFQHVTGATGADAVSLADSRNRLALLAIDPEHADSAELADLETRAGKAPDDPVILTRLSAIEARQGASAGAAQHFEEVLKLTPENPRVMMDLAQLYAGPLHAPEKARALAKHAHELAPNDAQISETLGRLLYRTGDYGWSLDLLQQATQGLPNDADLQYDLALAEFSAGRISDAESTLNNLIGGGRTYLHHEDVARLAAMIAAGKSPAQAEAALPEARKILGNDPTYIPAMAVSALALEKEGDASGAATAYENLLGQDPIFAPATRELAVLYSKQSGADQKAYDMAVKAREEFPEDAGVATALGIADYRRKEYGAAALLFQDSLSRRADDAETTYYLGMSHLSLKQNAKAKAELKHAIALGLPKDEADDANSGLAGIK